VGLAHPTIRAPALGTKDHLMKVGVALTVSAGSWFSVSGIALSDFDQGGDRAIS
jgi:hypothetical protein